MSERYEDVTSEDDSTKFNFIFYFNAKIFFSITKVINNKW